MVVCLNKVCIEMELGNQESVLIGLLFLLILIYYLFSMCILMFTEVGSLILEKRSPIRLESRLSIFQLAISFSY